MFSLSNLISEKPPYLKGFLYKGGNFQSAKVVSFAKSFQLRREPIVSELLTGAKTKQQKNRKKKQKKKKTQKNNNPKTKTNKLEMCPQYTDAPAVGYLTIKLQNSTWYKCLNRSLTGSRTYVHTHIHTEGRTFVRTYGKPKNYMPPASSEAVA